jgi:hypothetical protein
MCRRFSSFGVSIMDMIIKGELIPLFRHLNEMIICQFFSYATRITRGNNPKIMSQLELAHFVIPTAHKLLHNLQENPGCVLLIESWGREKYFISKRPQCVETLM